MGLSHARISKFLHKEAEAKLRSTELRAFRHPNARTRSNVETHCLITYDTSSNSNLATDRSRTEFPQKDNTSLSQEALYKILNATKSLGCYIGFLIKLFAISAVRSVLVVITILTINRNNRRVL